MRRGRLLTDDKYTCQARTVAGGSLLASISSLAGVGVGMWLLIFSQDFVLLIGLPLRDAFAGYSVFASYMLVTGMIGAVVSLKRSAMGLLIFAALLLSNLVCQVSISTYLTLQGRQVMRDMNTTILSNTDCRVFDSLVYKFHCQLQRIQYLTEQCRLDVESDQTDLQSCSKKVNEWLTRGVWSAIAVSAILMAFQLLLTLTSIMLRHMITEIHNYIDCCCPWQRRHNKTHPGITRIDVTPATNSVPNLSDSHRGAGYYEGTPYNQEVVNLNFMSSSGSHHWTSGTGRTRYNLSNTFL